MDMRPNDRHTHAWFWLLPVGIFLLGLGLRLTCLDCLNLWYDEIASVETAQSGIEALFNDRFGWMLVQSPFHYLLVWLTLQPADPTATATFVRLPSAIAGALLPLLVYGIGRETFGRLQGLFAALFSALSIALIDLSQDVRPYSMLAFLTVLSVYCLLMSERTGSAKWWSAFALVTAANILHAYTALTLVMPALAPYMLWALWRLWSNRSKERRPLYYAGLSYAALAVASLFTLLSLIQVPRIAPDLSKVSLGGILNVCIQVLVWFTRFDLGDEVEVISQLGLLLLAILGVYAGVKAGQGRWVILCVLLCLVPSILLAILSTTNSVFPRYTLFVGPFYFLLAANALASLVSLTNKMSVPATIARTLRVGGAVIAGLVALVFVAGALRFAGAEGHADLTYHPDFRGAARYLSQHATPQDLIVFIDDPSLGYTAAGFYWRGSPPAPAFDARDPRLFAHKGSGDILFVMNSLDSELTTRIADPSQGWTDVQRFHGVAILHEADSDRSVVNSMERLVAKLATVRPDYPPIVTLQGCVAQARGDATRAAELYRKAGSYFLSDNEYLQTAQGFAARGEMEKAWREAAISKFMRPGNPELQIWLAQQLQQAGFESESRIATQVAQALQAAARKP